MLLKIAQENNNIEKLVPITELSKPKPDISEKRSIKLSVSHWFTLHAAVIVKHFLFYITSSLKKYWLNYEVKLRDTMITDYDSYPIPLHSS